MTPSLSIVGWEHARCRAPLLAATAEWTDLTGIEVDLRFRTLEEFGDQPLEDITATCDLVVYDHPHVARAVGAGALAALDDLIAAEELERLAAAAVGPSHAAYAYAGRQWGLAADAACQVLAYRPDRVAQPPATWTEVLELAARSPVSVALPHHPTHLLCAYLTLCANLGGDWRDPTVGARAVDLLRAIRGTLRGNGEPPVLLADLTSAAGAVAVVPVVFGYVTYAVPGPGVEVPCRFVDLPSAGHGPVGGLLGGAGLGVSAGAREPEAAARFAAWFCSPDVQLRIVAPAGGQPAAHAAWSDPSLDASVNGFYAGTLATMETASIRPRDPAWPDVQVACGRELADGLDRGRSAGSIAGAVAARLAGL